jgi:hypothetical protein
LIFTPFEWISQKSSGIQIINPIQTTISGVCHSLKKEGLTEKVSEKFPLPATEKLTDTVGLGYGETCRIQWGVFKMCRTGDGFGKHGGLSPCQFLIEF